MYINQDNPISTGLSALDNMLEGGIKPYFSYLFYGEAGTGKTLILKNIIVKTVELEKPVLIFSYKSDIIRDITLSENDTNKHDKFTYFKVNSFKNLLDIINNIPDIARKYRVICIDDLNLISIENDRQHQLRTLLLLKNLLYKWSASLIIATGISQKPGYTDKYNPKISKAWLFSINYIIFLSKVKDNVIRAVDINRNKSVYIQIENGVKDI